MPDEDLRAATDAIGRRIQEELELQFSILRARHDDELRDARATAEAEADARWARALEAERSDWAARLEAAQAAAREDAQRLQQAHAAAREEAEGRIAAEAARLRAEADEAAASLARVTQELTAQREESGQETARLHRELDSVRAELQGVRDGFDHARVELDTLRRALDGTRAEFEDMRRERDSSSAELQEALADRDARRADLERAQAALDTARTEMEALRLQLEEAVAARRQLEAALEDARRTGEQAHRADEQLRDRTAAVALAERLAERSEQLAIVERLLGSVKALDRGRSLSEVLTGLAEAAGAEARRVALFLVGRNEVRLWKATGFEAAVELTPSELPGTALGQALRDRASVVTAAGADPRPPAFAALPSGRAAIAVPLVVGAQPVAVLYADDGGEGEPEAPASWPEAVQILARHAAMILAHLTATRAAQASAAAPAAASTAARRQEGPEDGASARRYARLLLSEIKLYNEAAVTTGREKRDLLQRLRPEIDRARTLYRQRVPPAVDAQGILFQQELIQTLADGDPALLGG